MTYSQIWLSPLVDESPVHLPSTKLTKPEMLWKEKPLCLEQMERKTKKERKEKKERKKERKKEKHNPTFSSSSSSSSSSVPTSVLCSSVSFFVPGRLLLSLPPVSLLSLCLSLSYTQGSQDQDPEASQKEWGERKRERERERASSVSLSCVYLNSRFTSILCFRFKANYRKTIICCWVGW